MGGRTKCFDHSRLDLKFRLIELTIPGWHHCGDGQVYRRQQSCGSYDSKFDSSSTAAPEYAMTTARSFPA